VSKTALLDAIGSFDADRLEALLAANPRLEEFRNDKGFDLLQICCSRSTVDDAAAAGRQLRMAKWLVDRGFDPRVVHTTAPGEDGEEDAAELSLTWFAVAKARNTRLARYFLEQGAAPGALFAAAWWGNADIIGDLVAFGADLDEVVGATPLHMAVAVVERGVDGKPALARQRLRVVKEMLRLGADPNVAAVDGTTPLHIALDRGYFDVFTLLVTHGASPDMPGKDARTVRDIAARKKDRRFAQALTPAATR
jgi:Ankyrin repeats (3 copies)